MVEIKKIGINGEGIGYINKIPVFVDGAFPGELVEVEIVESHRTYARAKLKKIIKSSDDRIKGTCLQLKNCDACPMMLLSYDKQLIEKNELLKESLYKYAGIRLDHRHKIIPSKSAFYFRNSLKLPVREKNKKLVTGMYKQGSNQFVALDSCAVHDKKLEEVKKTILSILNQHRVKAYDMKSQSGLRTLVIRGFGREYQCTFITGKMNFPQELLKQLMKVSGLVSIYQGIDTRKDTYDLFHEGITLLSGKKNIELKLLDYKVSLYPQSFFQLNLTTAESIYRYAVNEITAGQKIVEAYAGIGGISLCASKKSKHVYGIESIPAAVKNAKDIARTNNIKNVSYICGDSAKELRKILKKEKIHTVVVDPPRSGLSDEMMEVLLSSKVREIIYISCNLSTLGKNLKILMKKFKVKRIQGFDMFPHTALVETVVKLGL